jgi:uncharacterized protein (TIGR00730 family)
MGIIVKGTVVFLRRIAWCLGLFFNLLNVVFQIIYGAWKMSRLPRPLVSIFGGARLSKEEPYWELAHQLSNKLVEANISVLTGGGPGLMEAASCGAIAQKKGVVMSMGIGVSDLDEKTNPCVQIYCELDYFFARKWLLTRYSSGFVVFPGGFGTLDELAEVLTLMQTKKIKQVPIVLMGVEYWKDFVDWIDDEITSHGLISPEHRGLFTLTDDLHQAFCLIRDTCELEEPIS